MQAMTTESSQQLKTQRIWRNSQDRLHIPQAPGVYVLVGIGGEVDYIGQSQNLRARISAHAHHVQDHILYSIEPNKKKRMALEENAIRRFNPPRNNMMTKHQTKRIGSLHPSATITELDALLIKQSTGTVKEIAEKTGIVDHTVRAVLSGIAWNHVNPQTPEDYVN